MSKEKSFFYRASGITLYNGDCLDVISHLISSRQSRFDFVFADPPFNIGQNYIEHQDNMEAKAYREFTNEWFTLSWFATKNEGLVSVHCLDAIAQQMLRYDHPQLKHWINWHYRFGQAKSVKSAKSCINCREHLLVYGLKDTETTFNPPLVASDRASKYDDKRTKETETPGQRVAFNIWGLPEDGKGWGRVQGNNRERWNKANGALVDHPNQLPMAYVTRAIETFTNPGDRILIPFAGSGTEVIVCRNLGREVVAIEKSKAFCLSIIKRLEQRKAKT